MPAPPDKHPLLVRWTHWLHVPLLAGMVWSGLLIYWANDEYRIGWGRTTILKFFPKGFYAAFNIPFRLAEGLAWHFVLMWFFILNGALFVLYSLLSGHWRELAPDRRTWRELFPTLLHEVGLRRTGPPLRGPYNAAQRVAYAGIIGAGLGMVLTGWAIYKPEQLGWLSWLLGSYATARLLHFLLMLAYVFFVLVHVAQVIRAGWTTFRGMVAGK